jgi:hypothetical protein
VPSQCSNVKPRISHPYTPSSDDIARTAKLRAELDRERAERDAWSEANAGRRRTALLNGPQLTDVDAALECICSCHPRLEHPDTHNGGASCPCQLSKTERAAQLESALTALSALQDDASAERRKQRRAETEQAATRLGCVVHRIGGAAPFTIYGSVAGYEFYLRERHGSWRLEVVPSDLHGTDPFYADTARFTTTIIAEGDEDSLYGELPYGEAHALEVAVGAVVAYARTTACEHETRTSAEHLFCRYCGTDLDEAERP